MALVVEIIPCGSQGLHYLSQSTWWRHQKETFSALLALWGVNPPVTDGFPHKGQWRGALTFSLICAWTNGSANDWDAGDLKRHRAHCDVTVINIIAADDLAMQRAHASSHHPNVIFEPDTFFSQIGHNYQFYNTISQSLLHFGTTYH